jgi:mannose-1-phosphate guanylyltransferase
MQPNIVLLAGGKGMRLWPLSNQNRSKQFIILPDINISGFQSALKRSIDITPTKNIVIITNIEYQELLSQQIKDIDLNIDDFNIIFEQHSNNTGIAAYYCCKFFIQNNNDQLTYFFPTDHLISEPPSFFQDILFKIDDNKINLFGEKTDNPCSNFGYLIAGKKLSDNYYQTKNFIEKPNLSKIEELKHNIKLYKNMGIYLSKPSVLYNEFHRLHQNLPSINFSNNSNKHYIDKIYAGSAIDKMISEYSPLLNFIEVEFEWKDFGSIESLYQHYGEQEFFNHHIESANILQFNEQNKEFSLSMVEDKVRIVKKN